MFDSSPLQWQKNLLTEQSVLTCLYKQCLLDHCIEEEGQVTDYNYKVKGGESLRLILPLQFVNGY